MILSQICEYHVRASSNEELRNARPDADCAVRDESGPA
jgi:hypothetical protein